MWWMNGRSGVVGPFAHGTPTMKRMGRAPMLVLCSRNARPQKGLVRRPHIDQYGCPSREGKQANLEGSIKSIVVVRRAQLRTKPGHSSGRENEQAWKGSDETAGMGSVLAEPPR